MGKNFTRKQDAQTAGKENEVKAMDILDAKKQVIEAGKALSESGLIARTWGNVSCRTDEAHFVITASGRNYMTLTPEEVIEVKIDDLSYDKNGVKPSSEKKVHREIYRIKEDANFVIHTHQSNASAVSAMGLSRIKLDREYPGLGNYVLCAEYGLPGTKRLCRNTAAAVKETGHKAVIMRNHGAVCYGRDYDEAFEIAHTLEEACGRYLADLGVDAACGAKLSADAPCDAASGMGAACDMACGANAAHGAAQKMEQELAEQYGGLWNSSPVILKYMEARAELKPYLDDFAQLVGTGLEVTEENAFLIQLAIDTGNPLLVKGRGALCAAVKESDCEVLSIVIEKNCRAALAAIGEKPLSRWESLLMRQFYLKKYSKREA